MRKERVYELFFKDFLRFESWLFLKIEGFCFIIKNIVLVNLLDDNKFVYLGDLKVRNCFI